MKSFIPKYRKGWRVKTPYGIGTITDVELTGVGFMYEVDKQWFSEIELEKA
jgi:hypothetical protein